MKFIKNRIIFYIFSLSLILASLFFIFRFGINMGIDLKGGSMLMVKFQDKRPNIESILEVLRDLNLNIICQPIEEKGIILKMKDISQQTHQEILKRLDNLSKINIETESFQSIGPTIGKELTKKTEIVIVLSVISILVYITFAFQKISKPVPSFWYAISGTLALCHDVLISVGFIVLLGKLYNVEFNIPIITALLTIFGYSINDTVVVFDRIRENLNKKTEKETFEEIIEKSIRQSFLRSFNTSFTTVLPLIFIYFLGGESLKYFALTLILGISFGTYSSLFLAPQLVFNIFKKQEKQKVLTKKIK
ncbi:MAG: protein translocase subunit SecF [Minisyncoccia bacterium]